MSTLWRGAFRTLALGLVAITALGPIEAAPPIPPSPQSKASGDTGVPQLAPRSVLDRYCVTCHNERRKVAGLMLDLADVNNVPASAEVWEKVIGKLRSGAMPPVGMPRPDAAVTTALVKWLETTLDDAAAAAPNPGAPTIHRLNRVEYTNAIRDLLALEVDGRALLPTDESGSGFDNNAGVLSLSPGLLERYMAAASKISRLAVGDVTIRPTVQRFSLSKLMIQDDRMAADLPFGSRGGGVIRHNFPLDGEYVIKVRLRRSFTNLQPYGGANREQLDLRLDGARLRLFAVGGECVGSTEPRCIRPRIRTGGASEYERTIDAPLEVRLPVRAGMRTIAVGFLKRSAAAMEGAAPEHEPAGFGDDEMSVDHVLVEGPIAASIPEETPSRQRIFVCRPSGAGDQESCARRILTTLTRRAYRRPVTDEDVQPFMELYRRGRSEGDFDSGIQFALEALLVSPSFLMRVERDPEGDGLRAAGSISGLELASRLSFFLWSSIPDDELIDVAALGKLREPKILEQQVRRMVQDPRSASLVENFFGQWLFLRNVRSVVPDARLFPEFSENLRDAFQRETELFVQSELRNDRSVVDLVTANYTYLNERLAQHYGVPNVYGSHFRRVTLTDDRRFGLLGHGSILTVTSYATRTSPVLRGKYLLDNFFGAPPPPPPPDVVTDLTQKPGEAPKSVRARLEAHRTNPICASCHARMDPLGFALENFDGIGKWRDSEAGTPIDASATLPDGTKFNGPSEFRRVLLSRRDEFVLNLTEKLLTYALGRGSEYYDRPAVRAIVREAALSDYRWSSIILGIVKSVPFQMRRARQEPAASFASSAPPPSAQR